MSEKAAGFKPEVHIGGSTLTNHQKDARIARAWQKIKNGAQDAPINLSLSTPYKKDTPPEENAETAPPSTHDYLISEGYSERTETLAEKFSTVNVTQSNIFFKELARHLQTKHTEQLERAYLMLFASFLGPEDHQDSLELYAQTHQQILDSTKALDRIKKIALTHLKGDNRPEKLNDLYTAYLVSHARKQGYEDEAALLGISPEILKTSQDFTNIKKAKGSNYVNTTNQGAQILFLADLHENLIHADDLINKGIKNPPIITQEEKEHIQSTLQEAGIFLTSTLKGRSNARDQIEAITSNILEKKEAFDLLQEERPNRRQIKRLAKRGPLHITPPQTADFS